MVEPLGHCVAMDFSRNLVEGPQAMRSIGWVLPYRPPSCCPMRGIPGLCTHEWVKSLYPGVQKSQTNRRAVLGCSTTPSSWDLGDYTRLQTQVVKSDKNIEISCRLFSVGTRRR